MVAASYLGIALDGGGYAATLQASLTILVWLAVIVGLAFAGRPSAPVGRSAVAAGLCLGGLLGLTLLSMLWASDNGRAFSEAVRTALYTGIFALIVIVAPRFSARLWLGGLAVGLSLVAAFSLGSRLEASLFPHQDLITGLPEVASRLSYPLNYWNGVAACMAVATVLLAWLGSAAGSAWRRALAVAVVPLVLLTLFFTLSRGGVVAAAVGVVVLLALGPRRPVIAAGLALSAAGGAALVAFAKARSELVDGPVNSPAAAAQGDEVLVAVIVVMALVGLVRYALDRRLEDLRIGPPIGRVVVGAACAALVAGAVVAEPAERLANLTETPTFSETGVSGPASTRLTSDAATGRYQYWEAALDAFSQDPLTGTGAGGYEAWWAQHGTIGQFIRDAHSLPIEMLAELGIGGILLVLGFFGVVAATGARRRRQGDLASPVGAGLAVLACGAVSASIDWTWEIPAAFLPVLAAAAVLTGPAAGGPIDGRNRYAIGVATLVAGWLAVFAGGVAWWTQHELENSREAVRRGHLDAAVDDARAASSVQPWAAAPYVQLGLVEERRGDLAAANEALAEAASRAPDDWRVWLLIARVKGAGGDAAGSALAHEKARSLNPRSPLVTGG